LRSIWPSIRRKKQLRSGRISQIRVRMRKHHQHVKKNGICTKHKVIVLLHHILLLDRLHGSLAHILINIHLWILVICTFNHILFNIPFHIQIMVHHNDQLVITVIRSKVAHVLILESVRRTASRTLSIYSCGGALPAYLTLKREACNECVRRNQWSRRLK
jgi:hypothetical protein